MTTTATPHSVPAERTNAVRTSRALTVAAATAAGVAVWGVASLLAGIDLHVRVGTSQQIVGLTSVIVTCLVAGLLGAGVLTLLERTTGWARRIWLPLASTALISSLVGPLGALTVSAGIALAAMHLVVGLTLITGLGRTARNARC